MSSVNDVLNEETEQFIEALQEASEYGVQIIVQIDDSDPRKQRFLESFQNEIQKQFDEFQNRVKEIVDHINDQDASSAEMIGTPNNELISEQLRTISGYYTNKCWEAVVNVAMRVLQPEQRMEINNYSNFQQIDQDFAQYEDYIFQCREQENKNVNLISRYAEALDVLKQSAVETDEMRSQIKEKRDIIIMDYDQAVRKLADQCQLYVQQIEHIQSEIINKKQNGDSMKSVLRIKPTERDQNLMTLKQVIQIINDIYAARQKEAELLHKKGRGQNTSFKLFVCQYFFTNYHYECEQIENNIKNSATQKNAGKQKSRPERFFYSVSFYAQTNVVCSVFQAEFESQIDEHFKFAAASAEERLDQIYAKQLQLINKQQNQDQEMQILLFSVLNTFYGDDNESISNVQMMFENQKHQHPDKEAQFQLLKSLVALYEFRKRKEQLAVFVKIFEEKDQKRLGVIPKKHFFEIVSLILRDQSAINSIIENKELTSIGTIPFTTAVRLLGKSILQPIYSHNSLNLTQ